MKWAPGSTLLVILSHTIYFIFIFLDRRIIINKIRTLDASQRQSVTKGNAIERVRKDAPIALRTIDGSTIKTGDVTHHTSPLTLSIGLRKETVSLDCTTLGGYPVILGSKWLRRNNPVINWPLGLVTFNDNNTHVLSVNDTINYGSNLPSMNLFAVSLKSVPPCTDNLASVPKHYHNFLALLSSEGAEGLPRHSKFDHTIPLLPNSEPPFASLYNMADFELKILKEYLDNMLKKGFIRPSESPAGASLFFVGKKDGSKRPVVDYRKLNSITIKD